MKDRENGESLLEGDDDRVRKTATDAVGEWVTSYEAGMSLKASGGGMPPDGHGVALVNRNAIEVTIEVAWSRKDLEVVRVEDRGVELLQPNNKEAWCGAGRVNVSGQKEVERISDGERVGRREAKNHSEFSDKGDRMQGGSYRDSRTGSALK